MFTGLVETVGRVTAAVGRTPCRLTIESPLPAADIAIGDSIAIDGCCLTVVHKATAAAGGPATQGATSRLDFEAAAETMSRTTIGKLEVGAGVHLERALRVGDRLGGHMVAGHVDGVGTLVHSQQRGQALYLGVRAPDDIAHLIAPRGSITLAGVSLTVTDMQKGVFEVCLIPHTLEVTHLGKLAVGQGVNLEADLIARYVERLMLAGLTPPQPQGRGLP